VAIPFELSSAYLQQIGAIPGVDRSTVLEVHPLAGLQGEQQAVEEVSCGAGGVEDDQTRQWIALL
jgi:hypothetical protein